MGRRVVAARGHGSGCQEARVANASAVRKRRLPAARWHCQDALLRAMTNFKPHGAARTLDEAIRRRSQQSRAQPDSRQARAEDEANALRPDYSAMICAW